MPWFRRKDPEARGQREWRAFFKQLEKDRPKALGLRWRLRLSAIRAKAVLASKPISIAEAFDEVQAIVDRHGTYLSGKARDRFDAATNAAKKRLLEKLRRTPFWRPHVARNQAFARALAENRVSLAPEDLPTWKRLADDNRSKELHGLAVIIQEGTHYVIQLQESPNIQEGDFDSFRVRLSEHIAEEQRTGRHTVMWHTHPIVFGRVTVEIRFDSAQGGGAVATNPGEGLTLSDHWLAKDLGWPVMVVSRPVHSLGSRKPSIYSCHIDVDGRRSFQLYRGPIT